ncbi:hypothetical protein [Streptomyces sp. CT34]|uniref:hypothetical protein n=1 Tax=Streptomyces sp. CT34 TaxID=1553907 RepID=UPI001F51CBC6|nr:hypothetical protein [Streptomyces sp. CT34]
MANPVDKRVSTDQQSTDRQNLVLAEAGNPTIAQAAPAPPPGRHLRSRRTAGGPPVDRSHRSRGNRPISEGLMDDLLG